MKLLEKVLYLKIEIIFHLGVEIATCVQTGKKEQVQHWFDFICHDYLILINYLYNRYK